jgi:hypothetical protein
MKTLQRHTTLLILLFIIAYSRIHVQILHDCYLFMSKHDAEHIGDEFITTEDNKQNY